MIHTGIVQYLSEIDTNIFLSFNGIHSPFWDYFMSSFTGKFIWIPMYATILYILLKNFHWKVVMCYVAAIALTITFADQMCSSIIRPVVRNKKIVALLPDTGERYLSTELFAFDAYPLD